MDARFSRPKHCEANMIQPVVQSPIFLQPLCIVVCAAVSLHGFRQLRGDGPPTSHSVPNISTSSQPSQNCDVELTLRSSDGTQITNAQLFLFDDSRSEVTATFHRGQAQISE